MSRELVLLRNTFKYFDKNKSWILSALFIFSITRDYVWYACFGVNILSYSTIQDAFISMFNYMIIFTVIPFTYLTVSLVTPRINNKTRAIIFELIKCVVVLIISFVYFFLFKKFVSFLVVISFLLCIINFYHKKNIWIF